jgi:Ca2+-binding RTX toxin-like protein
VIRGDGDDNVLDGAGANDRIIGRDGDDTINGGAGADVLKAGSGDDVVAGGAGADKLWGDAGADTFVLAAEGQRDRIKGFDPAEDVLRLDADLTGGLSDGAAIVAEFGEVVGGSLLLKLENGTSIVLEGIDEAGTVGGAIEIA